MTTSPQPPPAASLADDDKRPQFGNRYLTDHNDVFKHNAWDDVEWDEEQEQNAKEMVTKNSTCKFSEEEVGKLRTEADEQWDKFYGIHQNRFFKDRHWLFTEFPELAEIKEGSILEVGCGVGNTVFPLLETNTSPGLKVWCCDFSTTAVELVKQHALYGERCHAFVCDISKAEWTVPFPPNSLDVIILLFVMSALDPEDMAVAVSNMERYLKPGGRVLFRDYGRYDLAQLRYKPGKCLSDNCYVRGDGTKCYFFNEEDVKKLFANFQLDQCKVDRRLQVNRGKQLKMYRVWLQCRFTKKLS